jgi:RsiW-degrading membrane proteinase PrsW (M82 family)
LTFASVAAAVLTSALPLAGAASFAKWVPRDARKVSWGALSVVLGLGILAGVGTFFAERAVLAFADLSIEASRGTSASALLALMLLVSPLDEVGKLASVWPMLFTRRLDGPRSGLSFSVVAACGFAASQTALFVVSWPFSALRVVRAVGSVRRGSSPCSSTPCTATSCSGEVRASWSSPS